MTFERALTRSLRPLLLAALAAATLGSAAEAQQPPVATPPTLPRLRQESIVHRVERPNEQMEMTVNTSRILKLDKDIPQAQVNNRDMVELTPLSPREIQVAAKSTGVTQINLWDSDNKLYTIDLVVRADARELQLLLAQQFPRASLRVVPVASGVLISGQVDRPDDVDLILRIAEEYYPKVIPQMTVSGVQQVMLTVKVMEVSRTKLRELGFDFAKFTNGDFIISSISGMLGSTGEIGGSVKPTMAFKVVDGNSTFLGVLDALRDDKLAKILSEPTLVSMSGQPASFLVGGEFTVIPQGLAAAQPRDIKFGTKVDFVPIVLGDGRIRLEVRPEVSEIDRTLTVDGVPGRRSRTVDTTVEMKAGQTLAIGGLVQERIEEAGNRGIPWISEVPYIGAAFRRVREQRNEVELLILVTPNIVDAMDPHEVPPCGPGMSTTSPNDCELYLHGHLEVPNCCPPHGACPTTPSGGMIVPGGAMTPSPMTHGGQMMLAPGETIVEPGATVVPAQPAVPVPQPVPTPPAAPTPPAPPTIPTPPAATPPAPAMPTPPPVTQRPPAMTTPIARPAPRAYPPPRLRPDSHPVRHDPVVERSSYIRQNRAVPTHSAPMPPAGDSIPQGKTIPARFIGPVGYDVVE